LRSPLTVWKGGVVDGDRSHYAAHLSDSKASREISFRLIHVNTGCVAEGILAVRAAMSPMKKSRAREAIIAEWLNLPPERREAAHQAASFAMSVIERFKWASVGDPYQEVMIWISGHIGKP